MIGVRVVFHHGKMFRLKGVIVEANLNSSLQKYKKGKLIVYVEHHQPFTGRTLSVFPHEIIKYLGPLGKEELLTHTCEKLREHAVKLHSRNVST